MLEMRETCERCGAPLPHHADAYICSFECTFCGGCIEALAGRCPNCGGELLQRPRRSPPAQATSSSGGAAPSPPA